MRFLARGLLGIALFALTLGLLVAAGTTVFRAAEERAAQASRQRPPTERVYSVNVEELVSRRTVPTITAFGEVESGQSLELRAASSGRLVALADAFREGGTVSADDLLFRVDPADAQAAVDLSAASVAEAEAELAEARTALTLAEDDVAAATAQRDLRAQAVERQRGLRERGAGTAAAVETAELALASAEQAVVGRRQALASAEARINRADIALRRQRISAAEAQRALDDTELRAPFAGLISEVSAVAGRLVGQNEKLGVLIDPEALEIAFRVSNAQYARLLDENGRLRPLPVEATLALDETPIVVRATFDRAGAQVGEGQTGRLIYARPDAAGALPLRPGDFMTIRIDEPALDNVAVIPATAATNDGRILLLTGEDRLEEAQVRILRRQRDTLIVSDVPFGRMIVAERVPQLGPGVKVRPIRPGAEMVAQEMVELTPERRARLIKAVEDNARMPAPVKARLIDRLGRDRVPAETVERLEARLGGGAPGSGAPGSGAPGSTTASEMVLLDADRQARLIAFVQGNDRMPDEARARVLEQLRSGSAPAEMVERLEGRMGGRPQGQDSASTAGTGQMVTLDADRQARLIAFVEGNDRMPAEARARVLDQLRSGSAPAEIVARIERRMGG